MNHRVIHETPSLVYQGIVMVKIPEIMRFRFIQPHGLKIISEGLHMTILLPKHVKALKELYEENMKRTFADTLYSGRKTNSQWKKRMKDIIESFRIRALPNMEIEPEIHKAERPESGRISQFVLINDQEKWNRYLEELISHILYGVCLEELSHNDSAVDTVLDFTHLIREDYNLLWHISVANITGNPSDSVADIRRDDVTTLSSMEEE